MADQKFFFFKCNTGKILLLACLLACCLIAPVIKHPVCARGGGGSAPAARWRVLHASAASACRALRGATVGLTPLGDVFNSSTPSSLTRPPCMFLLDHLAFVFSSDRPSCIVLLDHLTFFFFNFARPPYIFLLGHLAFLV
jgi:hypothetical protein